MIKPLSYLVVFVILLSGILIVTADNVSGEINAVDRSRPELPEGEPHTDKLVHLIEPKAGVFAATLSETKILIVTSGHGPLTGISPQDEKNYWQSLLGEMGYTTVDWYDGIPTFDLLNQYDLVIYDAGGYYYPLSNEVEPLWDYHFAGKPLIIVAPDVNYDWANIESSSKPTFCEDVTHITGALGMMPEVGFEVIANTGHEIIVSVPTDLEIPVASGSSWPDCFDPAPDCDGVLTQGYIDKTEFGVGSCSDLPSYLLYDPEGNLFSVVAYSGSESEGRTVLYGFPPTAIEASDILDLLAEGTINWALAKEKPADIDLTLYIEDATTPEDAPAIVNKAPGDVVNIVAVVVNKEESSHTINVELTNVPSEFGTPEMIIVRKNFSPHTRNTIIYSDVLSVDLLDLEPGEMQVVWRFRISDSASPQSTIVQAEAKVGGVLCAADAGGLHIIDNVDAIIVTNRYLLYDKYDDDEVGSLLRYLYQISEWGNTISRKNCIVYYVDHYDEDLEDWDQDVDYSSEDTANEVANDIDDLIEDWHGTINPVYLMIIGGDEVIPFYRVESPLNENSYGSDDPVLNTYDNNYYLSDVIYANTDANNEGWKEGSIDVAFGRVSAASAEDMRFFIENGISSPELRDNSIVATGNFPTTNEFNNAVSELRDIKGFNILNDGQPIGEAPNTIGNNNWGLNTLKAIMEEDYNIFIHSVHADYDRLLAPNGGGIESDDELANDNNIMNAIENNRPYFVTTGCYAGVLTDENGANWNPSFEDNLVWALAHDGISGFLAPSTYGYIPHSDDYLDSYFTYLIVDSTETNPVGAALKDSILHYNPSGFLGRWTDKDRITITTHLLYGVPWMTIDPKPSSHSEGEGDFKINISNPELISPNTYKRMIEINLTNYSISKINNFNIIKIDESINMRHDCRPILPKVTATLSLPKDSKIIDLNLLDREIDSIGNFNIPCAMSYRKDEDCSGMINCSDCDVLGFFPNTTSSYWYNLAHLTNRNEVIMNIVLAQYNPQTNETVLNNYTKLELTYQTPITAAITDFSPTKTEYTSGEPISTSVTIDNVGSDALTGLQADLSLIDPYGQVKASELSSTFDVASGESKTISVELDQSLPHGSYLAELNVINSTGGILGSSSEHIYISTGGITDFFLPSEIESGEDITFNITFENGNTTSVEATGVVYIYDPYGIEIAKLPSLPVTVAPDTEELISITWNTAGKEIGDYEVAAYVFTNGESFGPEYRMFEIKLELSVPLHSGWNLISAPLNLNTWELGQESAVGDPLNVTPENSLASVYRYNTTSESFEMCIHYEDWGWDTAIGSESFTELEPGKGYWVMADNDCTLTFTGTAPSDLDISLDADWNCVGWYSTSVAELGQESLVVDPFNVTPANSLASVYRYNTTSESFEMCIHYEDWGWDTAIGSESFTELEPGKGYWVWAESNCVWNHET